MSFQQLREKLSQEPSYASFREICLLMETWDDGNVGLALDYTNQHLGTWDDGFRYAIDCDWSYGAPIWWSLIRSYRHSTGQGLPTIWKKHPILVQELTSLYCIGNEGLQDIDALAHCTNLTFLAIKSCPNIDSIDTLSQCKKLGSLTISNCDSLKKVCAFEHLTELKQLSVNYCWQLQDIGAISSLTNLTELYFGGCDFLKDTNTLANLTNLTKLKFVGCHFLEDIGALKNLTKLKDLRFSSCRSLQNLEALEKLTNLHTLSLFSCKNLDVPPKREDMGTKEKVAFYQRKLKRYYVRAAA